MKTAYVPFNSSVDPPPQNKWYIYTMEYYAAESKKELLPFATSRMELENIILSGTSDSMKDKCHMISPIRGI